jgi:hypothetical protein
MGHSFLVQRHPHSWKTRHDVQCTSGAMPQEPRTPVASLLVPEKSEPITVKLGLAQDEQYALSKPPRYCVGGLKPQATGAT